MHPKSVYNQNCVLFILTRLKYRFVFCELAIHIVHQFTMIRYSPPLLWPEINLIGIGELHVTRQSKLANLKLSKPNHLVFVSKNLFAKT